MMLLFLVFLLGCSCITVSDAFKCNVATPAGSVELQASERGFCAYYPDGYQVYCWGPHKMLFSGPATTTCEEQSCVGNPSATPKRRFQLRDDAVLEVYEDPSVTTCTYNTCQKAKASSEIESIEYFGTELSVTGGEIRGLYGKSGLPAGYEVSDIRSMVATSNHIGCMVVSTSSSIAYSMYCADLTLEELNWQKQETEVGFQIHALRAVGENISFATFAAGKWVLYIGSFEKKGGNVTLKKKRVFQHSSLASIPALIPHVSWNGEIIWFMEYVVNGVRTVVIVEGGGDLNGVRLAKSGGLSENLCVYSAFQVLCWGSLKHGIVPMLPSDSEDDYVAYEELREVKLDLPNGVYIADVAISGNTACALLSCGGIKCWGSNEGLRLGTTKVNMIPAEKMIPFLSIGCVSAESVCREICPKEGKFENLYSRFKNLPTAEIMNKLWEKTECIVKYYDQVTDAYWRDQTAGTLHEALRVIRENPSYDPFISNVANKLNRSLFPTPRNAGGTSKLPLYSMERILTLPGTEDSGLWSFEEEKYWEDAVQKIQTSLIEGKDFAKGMGNLCSHISDNFESQNNRDSAIEDANYQEAFAALEALTKRSEFSRQRFVELYNNADFEMDLLKIALDNMYAAIEAYQKALAASKIFDIILKRLAIGFTIAVAILAAPVGGAAVIVGAAAAVADLSVGIAEDVGDIMRLNDDLTDNREELESLIAQGIDVSELQKDGAKIDPEKLLTTSADFMETLESLTRELFYLSSNLLLFLEEYSTEADTKKSVAEVLKTFPASSVSPSVNPLVWDSLFLQIKTQFEAAAICAVPEIPQERRLSTPRGRDSLAERSLPESMESKPLGRSLLDKTKKAREAMYAAMDEMQFQCEDTLEAYRELTTQGKILHSEFMEASMVARELRVSKQAKEAYEAQRGTIDRLERENCGKALQEVEAERLLNEQLARAKAGLQSQVDEGIDRLLAVCGTIQYLLNPKENVCAEEEIRGYTSLAQVRSKFSSLQRDFQSDWEKAVKEDLRSYAELDITELVDMDAIRSMNDNETFTFNLNPEDVARLDSGSTLPCTANVEVSEVAVVFRGTREPTQSYTTISYLTGPFKKVRSLDEGEYEVGQFLPTREIAMGFTYKINSDNTCDSAEGEMAKICEKQICRVASSADITENQKYVLPSLFATYTVKVATWGVDKLEKVNSVHLVFKGRWSRLEDASCSPVEKICVWEESTSIGLIVGLAVSGCVGLAGGGYFIRKKMKNGKSGVMTALPVYGKDGAVNPSFAKADIIQANGQAFTPGNAAQNGMNNGRTNRFFSFRGPGSARALFGRGGGGGQWSFRSGQRPSNGPNNSGQGLGPNDRGDGRGMFGTSSGGGYGGNPSPSSGYGQQQSGPNSFGGRQGGPPLPARNQMMVSELAGHGVGRDNMYGGNPHMRKEDTIPML